VGKGALPGLILIQRKKTDRQQMNSGGKRIKKQVTATSKKTRGSPEKGRNLRGDGKGVSGGRMRKNRQKKRGVKIKVLL